MSGVSTNPEQSYNDKSQQIKSSECSTIPTYEDQSHITVASEFEEEEISTGFAGPIANVTSMNDISDESEVEEEEVIAGTGIHPNQSNNAKVAESSLAKVAEKEVLKQEESSFIPALPKSFKISAPIEADAIQEEVESPIDDLYQERYKPAEKRKAAPHQDMPKKSRWLDNILN